MPDGPGRASGRRPSGRASHKQNAMAAQLRRWHGPSNVFATREDGSGCGHPDENFAQFCDPGRPQCVFKYCKALDMPCVFLICDTSRPLYWGRRMQKDHAPRDTSRSMTRRGSHERLSDYTPDTRIRRSRRHHRSRSTRGRHRHATLSLPRRRRDLRHRRQRRVVL